ncbi:MAG: AAA family ATPase, partial [Magnetococcales bacterium]|nr:AAA family ATPase [Magnetococcales bacterium]
MNTQPDGRSTQTCWFVGATWGKDGDQTPRFLEDGIWQNGYDDKYLDLVKSIQPGDRIAIKSVYTRKNGLPFDNREHSVSVMAIKVIGTVTENIGDGCQIKVEWTKLESLREWYFYTYRGTIWRVLPGDWMNDELINFAFEEKTQDITRFRNAPYWQARFGDKEMTNEKFKWTLFYEDFADKLIGFKNNREELVTGIHAIAAQVDGLSNLQDQFQDGTTGPLKDICPFTTIGIFNRSITDTNRKIIAKELADFLGVDVPVPESFDGIPVLNNQRSWLFAYAKDRKPNDIDSLWEVFEKAIQNVESEDTDTRLSFIDAFDNPRKVKMVGWNLTMGLYWIRPWNYPTLETKSRHYINEKLGINIGLNGPKKYCSAKDYLIVLDTLETRFQEEAYPVHSFPQLSYSAWLFKDGSTTTQSSSKSEQALQTDNPELEPEEEIIAAPIEPYSVDNIVA